MSSKYIAWFAGAEIGSVGSPTESETRISPPRHWSTWAAWLAAAWSLGYGLLGLYWSLGGTGFPFGVENDLDAGLSALAGWTAEAGAPVVAALGLAGAVVAAIMALGRVGGPFRWVLAAFGAAAAVTLALLIPDYRVLVVTAYLPVFIAGAPFGWPSGVSLLDAVTWPVVNQAVLIGGGLAWAAASVAFARRSRGACPACGRLDGPEGWTSPRAAARWGRWAVAVAVVIPLIYAATRWAWALGIPLGISEAYLRQGAIDGAWIAGAALATVAVAGAVLTVGLVRPWGEVFPRWMPAIGGRRVPPAVAIVPASLVAVIVTSAGLMFIRMLANDPSGALTADGWAPMGPTVLWPIWGFALAAATLAYHLRRRGRCSMCGRPEGQDAGGVSASSR
jgi:hypothetical protein